jgi:hypothetical protein
MTARFHHPSVHRVVDIMAHCRTGETVDGVYAELELVFIGNPDSVDPPKLAVFTAPGDRAAMERLKVIAAAISRSAS